MSYPLLFVKAASTATPSSSAAVENESDSSLPKLFENCSNVFASGSVAASFLSAA